MKNGLSDQIRAFAKVRYVQPAVAAGKVQFSISVREILTEMRKQQGFPARHTPQICSALQTSKFLHENGLVIDRVDGPPSGQSPTVVVNYRITGTAQQGSMPAAPNAHNAEASGSLEAARSERARRLSEKLRGLLKNELAEYGGGDVFVRWVRGEGEEDAA